MRHIKRFLFRVVAAMDSFMHPDFDVEPVLRDGDHVNVLACDFWTVGTVKVSVHDKHNLIVCINENQFEHNNFCMVARCDREGCADKTELCDDWPTKLVGD